MKEYFSSLFATPRMGVAQIIGFLAMAGAIICFQQKDRKKLMLWQLVVCLLWTLHFSILGMETGAVINGVQVIRTVIFSQKEDKKWAGWNGWLIIFMAVTVFLGIITWNGIFSLFPIIGTCFATISMWMKKPFTIRALTVPVAMSWFVYDVASRSIAGACNEIFCLCSIIVAFFRIDFPERKKQKALKMQNE